MSAFPVSFMLAFAVIVISLRVESLLDLLKGIRDLILFSLIHRSAVMLITVPVHISLCAFLIDVVTVVDIEAAVIMLRIVSAILSRSAIVSCQLHWQLFLSVIFLKPCFFPTSQNPEKVVSCRQVIPNTKCRFPTLNWAGPCPRPAPDASPQHPDKRLPPLNSVKGNRVPLDPLLRRIGSSLFGRQLVSVPTDFAETFTCGACLWQDVPTKIAADLFAAITDE